MLNCPEETRRDNICYPVFCIALDVVAEWVGIPCVISLTTIVIVNLIQIMFHLSEMVSLSLVRALRLGLMQ